MDEPSGSPIDTSGLGAFREAMETGSHALRDDLITSHIAFANFIARRYRNRGVGDDDLRQVALVGLVKSVDRFDPDRGVAFTSFAGRTIEGEIKRYFRDKAWSARVPRSLKNLNVRVREARDRLPLELGRTPQPKDIALDLGVTTDEVLDATAAGSAYSPLSIHQPLATRHGEPGNNENTAVATIASIDANLERADDRILTDQLIGMLDKREQRIIRLRFWEGLTQREIGELVGLSQMQISRLLRRSIETMREAIRRRRTAVGA